MFIWSFDVERRWSICHFAWTIREGLLSLLPPKMMGISLGTSEMRTGIMGLCERIRRWTTADGQLFFWANLHFFRQIWLAQIAQRSFGSLAYFSTIWVSCWQIFQELEPFWVSFRATFIFEGWDLHWLFSGPLTADAPVVRGYFGVGAESGTRASRFECKDSVAVKHKGWLVLFQRSGLIFFNYR